MSYIKTNWVNGQNPPISAANLNKIENQLEVLSSKSIGSEIFTTVSGTISSGSWQTLITQKSITLDPGTYLLLVRVGIGSGLGTVGIGTIRIMLNNGELTRQSFPNGAGLTTTTIIPHLLTVSSTTTYTIDLQGYFSQVITMSSANLNYIKLD